VLQFARISKAFVNRDKGTGVIALKDIDLRVEENEFLCLVGPSGCGKSTLLNLAAGFDFPSQGKVMLDGMEVKGPNTRIGMVFQEASLFPWLSVIDNVQFGLKVQGVAKEERKRRAREMLELVDLSKFELSRPSDLSGGMKQKVAIARTLVMDPAILLMDEPFGALDEQARKHLDVELLGIWQRRKKTVVFVTHNIEEAIFLGTRVVLMSTSPGRIFREWNVTIDRPRDMLGKEVAQLRKDISNSLQEVLTGCGCKRVEILKPIVPRIEPSLEDGGI